MKCTYCLPKSFKGYQEPKNWLTFDEIERVVGAFGRLGTSRIRLTGGEPLLRRNLPDLAARISALPGIKDLSLSTNGTQLPKHAAALRAAGVTRLNISLDSLDRECVTQITGRDTIDDVMAGLDAAQEHGFSPIKLNMVVMPGVNEHEIEAIWGKYLSSTTHHAHFISNPVPLVVISLIGAMRWLRGGLFLARLLFAHVC
jgi:cyclic pyranopterin phosphate synthase